MEMQKVNVNVIDCLARLLLLTIYATLLYKHSIKSKVYSVRQLYTFIYFWLYTQKLKTNTSKSPACAHTLFSSLPVCVLPRPQQSLAVMKCEMRVYDRIKCPQRHGQTAGSHDPRYLSEAGRLAAQQLCIPLATGQYLVPLATAWQWNAPGFHNARRRGEIVLANLSHAAGDCLN